MIFCPVTATRRAATPDLPASPPIILQPDGHYTYQQSRVLTAGGYNCDGVEWHELGDHVPFPVSQ
jgi:hypothetical protein